MAREQWGSRIGVILAVAGSAVGLGNFLRFPGNAAANGGGAFMIPYFLSLLLLGIPLCWAEWNMGRFGGVRGFHSCPGIFNAIWRTPMSKYFGALGLIIPLVIYMFYVVIEAWCLGYAYYYVTGSIVEECGKDATQYDAFFKSFVGQNADGSAVGFGNLLIWVVLITFVLNFILIYRGITRGIETFCKIAMPIMVICALCVLVRVLTLGTPDPEKPDQSVLGGLGFMWNPNLKALWEPETWMAAAGQIFFSISVGFGIIVNYASYLRRNDDIVLSGLTAATTNEFFEVCLGGLITLPAAVIFLGTSMNINSTFDLGFKSLPVVFANMPLGQFFGFVWFFMLFLAAMTSSLSMLQPVIAFFEEGFDLPRKASVAILGMLGLVGSGIVIYFSKDLIALDTFDFWVGTALIYVLAMIQVFMYSYIFGSRAGWTEAIKHPGQYVRATASRKANEWRQKQAHIGAHIRIPNVVTFVLKYISPLFLLTIFVAWCVQKLPDRIRALQEEEATTAVGCLMFIGGLFVFMILLIGLAGPGWERRLRKQRAAK